MMSVKEFRKYRDQAGTLWILVYKAKKKGKGQQAIKIYRKWKNWKITYKQAKKQLLKLLNQDY